MDNITHTLVGAALGRSGLKRLTGLAMPALMIGANIPDVDILAALAGDGLTGRRGWTHGPIGILVLPALLAAALLFFDEWQARRGRRPTNRLPTRPAQLLLLCYVGALSHPLLDLMNSWGIRLLMPFSERWFYGDALFIADPWIWLALGVALWFSRRQEASKGAHAARPAAIALLAVVLYAGAMLVGSRWVEDRVAHQFEAMGLGPVDRVTAMPVFADSFRRQVVVQSGDHYGLADFQWLPQPTVTLDRNLIPTHMQDPAVRRAEWRDPAVADFLYWSRYPFAAIDHRDGEETVRLGDARFSRTPGGGMIGVSSRHGGDATTGTKEGRNE